MQPADPSEQSVQAHYAGGDLGEAVLSALAAAGKDIDHLRPEDLAAIDEFHIRGRDATRELAELLRLSADQRVLDVGCGLGGAARFLASKFGCRVTGLDLTDEYCRVAQMLSARVGLAARITYRQGSALDMPFEAQSFDLVWTQHAAMNIADKQRLYAEIWRVLRPGGFFAAYDILAGPGGPLHFPVPWARDASISSLATPGELRDCLERTGLRILSWRDTSAAARAWFRDFAARMQKRAGSPALGLHVLLGPEFGSMALNQVRNLEEQRIVLVECLAQRPAAE